MFNSLFLESGKIKKKMLRFYLFGETQDEIYSTSKKIALCY